MVVSSFKLADQSSLRTNQILRTGRSKDLMRIRRASEVISETDCFAGITRVELPGTVKDDVKLYPFHLVPSFAWHTFADCV